MWRFLDRWNTITGYLIGGVWLLYNGNFYNNGMVDIKYVYFFNISGTLMLVLVALKIFEKFFKKNKGNQRNNDLMDKDMDYKLRRP